jgi:hypothetical protein
MKIASFNTTIINRRVPNLLQWLNAAREWSSISSPNG